MRPATIPEHSPAHDGLREALATYGAASTLATLADIAQVICDTTTDPIIAAMWERQAATLEICARAIVRDTDPPRR